MEFDSRKYFLTCELILLKVLKENYPNFNVEIKNSLNNGVYFTIKEKENFSVKEIEKIKNEMKKIIENEIEIEGKYFSSENISKKYVEFLREDLKELFETTGIVSFYIYKLNDYTAYFIEELYDNTKYIKDFEIYAYEKGFILKTLKDIDGELIIPPMIDNKKMAKIFEESSKWNEIMGVSYLGSLNRKILDGKIVELIRINEALHTKKIVKIAEKISETPNIKIVTIAGPSSSGKTTFSKKLNLQLLASGLCPLVISLDDYYVGRENVPLDEYGNKDFESIEALDINLLNENLKGLLRGEEVEIPRYNFVTGMREEIGERKKLEKNSIIVLEGIHGLNEKLILGIEKEKIFKIYISCLTQLNIDAYNRVKTSIVRKLRRIVRDSISRDFNAEETLEMWDRVRRGESKNIFPYQENADVIFDTSLTYEIGVLRPYAEKELVKVKIDSPYYSDARYLLRLLSYFTTISDKYIPDESLLKEFIGGSFFYKY